MEVEPFEKPSQTYFSIFDRSDPKYAFESASHDPLVLLVLSGALEGERESGESTDANLQLTH